MNIIGFRKELQDLINKHSIENGSNTPDFILADYLVECLQVFENTIKRREQVTTKTRVATSLFDRYKEKHHGDGNAANHGNTKTKT